MAAAGSGSGSRAGSCPRVLLRRGLGAKLMPARQISGAVTATRALSSPLPFPEDATGLGLFGPTWSRRARSGLAARLTPRWAERTGMGLSNESLRRRTEPEGLLLWGRGVGRRPASHPEPAGRMELAPAHGGRGRGGGSGPPAWFPGSLGTARLPGTPVVPCTGFRGSLSGEKEKKREERNFTPHCVEML